MAHREVKTAAKQSFFVDFSEHWSGLNPFRKFNWRNFTLIKMEGEYAKYSGRVELDIYLIGFGVRFTYIFDHSFNERMNSTRDEILGEIMGRTGVNEVVDQTGGALDEMIEKIDAEKRKRS